MKRFALVLVLALIAISSVFALSSQPVTKSAEVSLTLKNSMFAEERFGFTFSTDDAFISTDANMDDVPTDISGNIQVNYENGVATSQAFGIYYKVRGAEKLTLKLGSCLYFNNTSNSKKIDYDMFVDEGKPELTKITSATTGYTKNIELSTSHIYEAALLPVSIVTTTPIDASYISDTAYTTLLVLEVKPA